MEKTTLMFEIQKSNSDSETLMGKIVRMVLNYSFRAKNIILVKVTTDQMFEFSHIQTKFLVHRFK